MRSNETDATVWDDATFDDSRSDDEVDLRVMRFDAERDASDAYWAQREAESHDGGAL